jgi:hypothetical protein
MDSRASFAWKVASRATRGSIVLALVAMAGQGCNSDGNGNGSGNSGALQAYENSYLRQLQLVCACDDEDLCVEARLNDRLDSCARSALEDTSAASTLNCMRQATDQETECIRTDACDTDHREDCFLDFLDDTDECPDLPNEVEDELDECSYLFECVDGETIDYGLVCDGNEDCADASDEVPC